VAGPYEHVFHKRRDEGGRKFFESFSNDPPYYMGSEPIRAQSNFTTPRSGF
jgi:hypothetical protein